MFGLIAIMYLNNTRSPVMYTRKRINANHELIVCLTSTVMVIAVHIRSVPNEIILFENGVKIVRDIIVIIVAVNCINVVWLVP